MVVNFLHNIIWYSDKIQDYRLSATIWQVLTLIDRLWQTIKKIMIPRAKRFLFIEKILRRPLSIFLMERQIFSSSTNTIDQSYKRIAFDKYILYVSDNNIKNDVIAQIFAERCFRWIHHFLTLIYFSKNWRKV